MTAVDPEEWITRDQQTQDESCESCRFWRWHKCRRSAPVPDDSHGYDIAVATKLLVWWAMREWSDEETANEQMNTFLINVEGRQESAIWPHTHSEDWCGEWERRT